MRSNYQNKVIAGYYDNLDTIVTELYLAETPTMQNRLWKRAHKAMIKLKVPSAIIDHIMRTRSVEILAKNLQDWTGRKK